MGARLGCVSVEEASVQTLERFGKFERVLNPGLHFFNPFVYQARDPLSLRLQPWSFALRTITKEQLTVTIRVGLQYRIDDTIETTSDLESVVVDYSEEATKATRDAKLYKAMYSVSQPLKQIEQHVDSFFRSFAAQHTLDELRMAQGALSNQLETELNKEMHKFGYIVYKCMVTDIDPPEDIKASMNTVLSSQNRRQAMINEAEGMKQAAILEAEGMCEVRRLEGVGLSRQRQALFEGVQESVSGFSEERRSENVAMLMTMQYLDVLNHAAKSGNNTFFLTSNPLGATTVSEQITSSMLAAAQKNQQQQPQQLLTV